MKIFQVLTVVSIFSIGSIALAQSNTSYKKKQFNLIDSDKNEVLTISEMSSYYKDKTTEIGVFTDGKKKFHRLDSNKNGIVTLSEFLETEDSSPILYPEKVTKKKSEDVTAKKNSKKGSEIENSKKRFNYMDTDSNNALSKAEFLNYYKDRKSKKGRLLNGKLYFFSYDKNNDGKVKLHEYLQKPDWELGKLRLKYSEQVTNSSGTKIASDGYIKKRIELFAIIDTNNDLKVTLKELKAYYKDKTNKKGKPVNASFKFLGFDANDDDVLEVAEFATRLDVESAKKKYKARKNNI